MPRRLKNVIKKKTKGDIQATEIVREKNVNIGY